MKHTSKQSHPTPSTTDGFAKRQEPPLDPYVIAYYDIPGNWTELEIVYRIEFPGRAVSDAQTIKLKRDKWWTNENIAEQVEAEERQLAREDAAKWEIRRKAAERESAAPK